MTKQKMCVAILILILSAGNVYFFLSLSRTQQELQAARAEVAETAQAKQAIIAFNQLFVDKVLRAEGEVSFEVRLELENKVRELKDAEVLSQWNNFVNAQTQADAQAAVKELLGLLARRMES